LWLFSSVNFGARKHKQAQDGMDELSTRIQALKDKKSELKKREIELKCKIDAIEKKNKESSRITERLNKAELDSLTHQGKEMSEFLETLREPSSPAAGSPKQDSSPKSPKK